MCLGRISYTGVCKGVRTVRELGLLRVINIVRILLKTRSKRAQIGQVVVKKKIPRSDLKARESWELWHENK